MPVPVITLPGINGSGDEHWQTLWERTDGSYTRFRPTSWDDPDLDDWCRALDSATRAAPAPPLLLAHSLGALLVAHWAARFHTPAAGAFLVAVPDPDAPAFPSGAASFADPPRTRLPFPSVVIASTTDPFASIGYTARCASDWGSAFVDVGDVGHINESSDLGHWRRGRDLLTCFRAPLDFG